MSDDAPSRTRPAQNPQPAGPAADLLDRVAWDFDPEDELLSPLITTERYFRDFPWDDRDHE